MAAARSRLQLQVGSAQWIASEHQQTAQFIEQEVEEFSYSVRNEMEWLNEHMAEVFSRSQFDVVEIFKTPGKLRAKTPRTARKWNPLENRQPLTDVFTSANEVKNSPALKSQFQRQISQFKVAEDLENHVIDPHSRSRFSAGTGKENTDSGYHDMTDEPMTSDSRPTNSQSTLPLTGFELDIPQQSVPQLQPHPKAREDRQESPGSFVSAQEAVNNKVSLRQEEPDEMDIDSAAQDNQSPLEPEHVSGEQPLPEPYVSLDSRPVVHDDMNEVQHELLQHTQTADDINPSSSETSTPDRPVVRKKSSLNFAALPAREPLTSKKSVGPTRMSTASHSNHTKAVSSVVASKAASDEQQPSNANTLESSDSHASDTEGGINEQTSVPGSQTKLHSLTSTQRLHERITMLGKMNPARPSKSIPSSVVLSQTAPPEPPAPAAETIVEKRNTVQGEEDWIEPLESSKASPQPLNETTTGPTATNLENPAATELKIGQLSEQANPKVEVTSAAPAPTSFSPSVTSVKPVTSHVSYPQLFGQAESTTPLGSPVRSKNADGPLNASKAKLYSVFQSAKGIFASSAGVSAQAKMEAMSPRELKGNPSTSEILKNIAYPTLKQPVAEMVKSIDEVESANNTPIKPPKRSSERLRQAKNVRESGAALNGASALADDTKDNIGGIDDVKASVVTPNEEMPAPVAKEAQAAAEFNFAQPKAEALQKSVHQPTHSSQKSNEMKRPIRPPPKEQGAKARPAPVSIRVASQKIAHNAPSTNNANFGASIHESQNAEIAARPQTLTKKASNSSIHTNSSTQSYKGASSAASGRPKALEAAARKREQDEREAQRKAEQKREIERRRAAKAEEDRRAAEEQKAVEQQKALEARKQAERKAEAAKKAEAQRVQQASGKSRILEDDNPFRPDRSQGPQNQPRSDLGLIRPVSRMGNAADERKPIPHINPAKPAKRHWNPDADEDWQQKQTGPNGQLKSQPQPKRRRTSEEEFVETISRPKMAPPVRLSKVAKDITNKFAHGFMSNTSASHQSSSSMMKSTVISQHQAYQYQQHPKTPHMNDLAKYTSGRIPFAEQPNPPQSGYTQQSQPRTQQQHHLKTPGTTSRQKSSPQYPNGENIELPEIASDSEDSDDDEFVPPDWANSPALRELLAQQQLIDPQKVFGPIAPLVMEEVFKGNKERMAKFRSRTSSANWNGPDRLTESERRRDQEAREKLERDGGWTYNAGL